MIECLHNLNACAMCCEETESGLQCQMLWLNPEKYPQQLGTQQVLRVPKDPEAGEWAVSIPVADADGETIDLMHTHVFLPYVQPNPGSGQG